MACIEKITKQLIQETLSKIKAKTGKEVRVDEVEWSGRMTRSWGLAQLGMMNGRRVYRIKLASKVFTQDSKAFRDTVIHEVAHLADFQIYNNWGHGATWKGIMRMLGAQPNRIASSEEVQQVNKVPKRKMLKFVYKCPCSTHFFSSRAHRSESARPGCYRCKHCKAGMKYTGQVTRA